MRFWPRKYYVYHAALMTNHQNSQTYSAATVILDDPVDSHQRYSELVETLRGEWDACGSDETLTITSLSFLGTTRKPPAPVDTSEEGGQG